MLVSMVAADRYKWVAWGSVRVKEIYGMNNQGADVYIMLFESYNPSNGDAPTSKPLLTQAKNGFKYSFPRGLDLKELYVALSSTPDTLTLVGAAGGLEVTFDVDTDYDPTGMSVTGDLTSGVDSLQVWTDATGPKTLYRVDVINGLDAVVYLQVFAVSTNPPADNAVPVVSVAVANVLTVQSFYPGRAGLSPFSQTGAYVQSDGCELGISSDSGKFVSAAGGLNKIRAYYK